MKEFKTAIINRIIGKADVQRIVSLYDTAAEMGYNHISTQDCRDIVNAVTKALQNYRAVKICTHKQYNNPATASLFTTLCFIENGVEFDGGNI